MANGKCRLHGGASTGPRTAAGILGVQKGAWKHGRKSKTGKAEQRASKAVAAALLAALLCELNGSPVPPHVVDAYGLALTRWAEAHAAHALLLERLAAVRD